MVAVTDNCDGVEVLSIQKKFFVNFRYSEEVANLQKLEMKALYLFTYMQILLVLGGGFTAIACILTLSLGFSTLSTLLCVASFKFAFSTLFLCIPYHEVGKNIEKQKERIQERINQVKNYALCIAFLNNWKLYHGQLFDLQRVMFYPFERLDLLQMLCDELRVIKECDEAVRNESSLVRGKELAAAHANGEDIVDSLEEYIS